MIALDIETTGLDERKNCMISLGAVHIESEDEFYQESKIYKESKVSERALGINGFNEDQINDTNKPYPHDSYLEFSYWCLHNIGGMPAQGGDELLIGQNLPSFDIKFLKHYHYNTLGNDFKWPFGHRYIDLHSYVFAKTGISQSHDDTLEMLGLPKEDKPHNALKGAKVVAKIYTELK